MAKVINVANFKGGVGKTTTTVLVGYLLAQKGYKTLVVDLDPQANATDMLLKTYDLESPDSSMYEAMKKKDLSDCLMRLTENLSLVPSALDLVGFPMLLNEEAGTDFKKRAYFLDFLLYPFQEEYDFIIIDVPPTISDYTNNAVVASNYVLVVMQTQERSLAAAEKFIPYLQDVIDNYGADIDLLGIIPVLLNPKAKIDEFIIDYAKKTFQEDLFTNVIKIRERIKRFDVQGISNEDHHDANALSMYGKVVDELLERVGMKSLKGVSS